MVTYVEASLKSSARRQMFTRVLVAILIFVLTAGVVATTVLAMKSKGAEEMALVQAQVAKEQALKAELGA
eukprot:scaffold31222_cov22-Prasinocladus_malaysianus.AAC.1